jgi:DNA mismatch repair ATPase MutS
MDDTVVAAFVSVGNDGRRVGLAVHGPSTQGSLRKGAEKRSRALTLYEFSDVDTGAFLDHALLVLRPSHVYLGHNLVGAAADALVSKCEAASGIDGEPISVEKPPASSFNDKDALLNLEKLAGGLVAGIEKPRLALKAAACIISRADLLASADAIGQYEVTLRGLDVYMRLDAAAVRALNLLPSARDVSASAASSASSGRITSVHCLLSFHARTRGGRRLLRQWILQVRCIWHWCLGNSVQLLRRPLCAAQPLTQVDAILARQRMVRAFVDSSSLRSGWKAALTLPDLDSLAGRFNRKQVS